MELVRLLIREELEELLPARYHSATDDALQDVPSVLPEIPEAGGRKARCIEPCACHGGREEPLRRDSGLRSVLLPSLDLSDAPSVRSVPMIILAISRSEPGVKPYPTPAFTSKRPILKSTMSIEAHLPPVGD